MAGKLFNIYSGNTGGVLSTSTAKVGSFGTTSDDFYSVNFDTGRKSIWTNNIEFGRAADWDNISGIPSWIGSDGVTWANVKDKPATATRWPYWSEILSKPAAIGSATQPVYWDGSTFQVVTSAPPASHNHDDRYLKLTGGTLSGDLTFSHGSSARDQYITWASGTHYQRLKVRDGQTDVFVFQYSTDSGTTWSDYFTIQNGTAKIGTYTVYHSGNLPAYPTVNNGALNLQASGTTKVTFYANQVGTSNFNIATGSANGTISVGGTDVAVKGLGSNAYSSTAYLPLAGGQMTGNITWKNATALPEQNSPQYFLVIDAFTDGGATKWASKANTLTALTGLTSTAKGTTSKPIYWDGTKFVECLAYSQASVNYANSAGTATNLENNPSLQAGTVDTKKITVTAGGKTSAEFTVPYATESARLYSNTLPESADLNNYTSTGVYGHTGTNTCASFINGPTDRTNGEMRLEVIGCNNNTNYLFQKYWARGGTSWQLYFRSKYGSGADNWTPWVHNIDSSNYTTYTVKKDGTGASGTWGISITGNAGSADKLKTARTITINGSSKTFDGSGNISWSLADLNLPSNEHNHDGRYLQLSGGTMTGAIKRHYATASNDPFYSVTSNNLDIWVWRVMHNASAASVSTSASYGFGLKYLGAGDGNNNDLALYSDNQAGTQVEAIRIKQDGAVIFSKQISSTLATGTSPFKVTSTTVNTNLNADLLDGVHANGLFTNFSNKTVSGNKVLAATIGGKELTVAVEYAGSANTATNLTNKPSLQAGTNDTNKITVTAGEKKSDEFTVPFATNSSKLDNIAASNYFKSRDYVYNSEWTGRFLWTIWDNHLWAADKRFNVTVTGTTATNFATLFNGSFEGYIPITDNTSVIHIKSNTDGAVWTSGLPYGNFYLVFYNSNAENITARVYCNYSGQGIGWHDLTVSNINKVWILANSYYQISDLEITITKPASSSSIYLSQILHQVTRSSGPSLAAVMSKYGDQKTYYNIEAAKFIGPLQGNADSATKLKTARTITINGSSKSFDGTGNISWSLTELNLPSNDHNHDTVYVKKAGDTMSGVLHLLGAQYTDTAGTGALDLANSDIYGVNSIKFADLADGAGEGLQWYRDATHTDSLWVKNGVIYFTPNRTWSGTGTDYTVWHSGNLTAATLLGSTAKGNTTKPIYWDGSKLVECLAYSQASVNYANTAGNADNVRWFVSGTSFDITETNKWYRIAYWKSTGEIRNSVSFYIKNNGGKGNTFWTKFSFDSDWQRAHAHWINIEGLISYVDGLCLSYDSEYIYINLHFKQTNLKHYYLYVPLNSTAPTTGNEMFTWLSGELPEMTGTVSSSYIAHGNTGFNSNVYISGAGFYKSDSSNSYVLLGGGGHKEESSLSVNYAANAGNAATADNADKLDTFHANELFQTFTNNATNNAVKIKIGDNEKSLVVGYATKANTANSSEASEYLNNYTTTDPNTGAIKASKVKWFAYITSSSGYAGNNYGFKTTNNANGILYLGTYSGKYGHQLGFSGNGNIYHRYQNGADFPNTANGGSWEVLLTSNNYTTITDTRYVKKAGDTMTGLLTTTSAHSHDGIKVGDTYINAINGNLIFQNNSAIRFGGDSWDYNVWAGLKYVHSSKTIYLGLADGSSFTANSAQSGGKLYLPGIDNIYTGNGTNLIWHGGNDGSGSGLDADLLDGYHAADFRNNIIDLRSSPQTFNPTYLKDIVFISEADYSTLISNGSITKNSITHTYNASNWYVTDKVPPYAERAGEANYASDATHAYNADYATNAGSASQLQTQVSLWGQAFKGNNNVSGNMTSVGQVTPDGNATRSNGTSSANWASVYTRSIISGDNLTLRSGTSKDIIFQTNAGTEHMRLTSGGLLGIGTNAPAYKLHVKGSQKIEGGSLGIYPVGGNYNDGIRLHARSSSNTWAAITFCASDNTGDTGISANSWFVGNNEGSFYITKNGSTSGTSFLCNVSNIWHIQNRISIDTTGRIYPYSTSTRRAGMYGVYDSHKIGHIWSMGTSYMISDDGLDPATLYGLAYFHTNWSNDATYNTNAANKTAIGTYAGGHQAGWFANGVIQASIGSYIWSRNGFIKNGSNNNYALTGGGGHKQWSESKTASTIVARTADNYIYAGYYNSDISDDESMTPTSVYCSNDKWIRKQSIDKFADNLRADEIITITKTLTVTEAWMDTGIIMNTDTFPRSTGTYAIQIYSDTYSTDGYYPYYSGIMSIYTASTNGSLEDEVPLHCVGYANGGTVQDKRIYIRTVEQLNSNAKIQIAAASALSSHTYTFKFRKLI